MLVNERAALVRVALVANTILVLSSAKLLLSSAAVHVVTIRALHQAFLHPMVERLVEVALDVLMAAVAEVRVLLGEQGSALGAMYAVAVHAGDSGAGVHAAVIVRVLGAVLVASHTDCRGLAGLHTTESRDLAPVAAAVDVCQTGAMTVLASFRTGIRIIAKNPIVRRALHHAGLIFVADLALVGTGELAVLGSSGFWLCVGFLFFLDRDCNCCA